MERVKKYWKRIWDFLRADSWASFAVTLVLAFIIIKFIFFPGLSLITGTSLPVVIVESCSMYHQESGFENTFTSQIYYNNGISISDTSNWDFQNGFSKGDVMFVVRPENIKVGDIIIFNGGTVHPIIHRVVSIEGDVYSTKGDNYKTNSMQLPMEKKIKKDQIIGKVLFRVPFVGWAKLIFFEGSRSPQDRGLCS